VVIDNLIRPELAILIPVLYFIGMGIKKAKGVSDNNIPAVLGLIGIALSLIWVLANEPPHSQEDWLSVLFAGITQGVLVAGAAVYGNQLIKQGKKQDGVSL